MRRSSLFSMVRKTLKMDPTSVSVEFERLPSGTRLVLFDGHVMGAVRMVTNSNGVRVMLGTNQFGWRLEGQRIRFLLRLMGLNV